MPKLTERQGAFCRHLITGMSATQAAKEAGYSESFANREASRLVDKPQVQAYLAKLREKVEVEGVMDARELLQTWTRIARGDMRVEKSTKVGVVELPPDFTERMKATELLAKYYGLFVERSEVTLKKPPEDMTDAELVEALHALSSA